ncbi:MAG TPA: histidine kinase dimerization/phosphoacceptor domain -containing protein [Allosphingosinicella sp.]|nr:histidine kinase dimerization/phosphoacceptor domain -containing protein [Allosphingosinicella sp.]
MSREDDNRSWIARKWARLSTGVKMLLILSAGLLPLGVIALLASLQSLRESNERRIEETQARVEIKAQRINSALSRSTLTIRTASTVVSDAAAGSGICQRTLQRLTSVQTTPGRYALFAGDGTLRCATPGYLPPLELLGAPGRSSIVEISEDLQTLRFALFNSAGAIEGAGEFTREGLAELTYIPGTNLNFDLTLVQGDRRMVLRDEFQDGPLVQTVRASAPVANGRMRLDLALAATPVGVADFLIMTLPVAMWLLSAVIGWFVLSRFVLRPLVRVQRAVAAYQPGDKEIDLPRFRTPAREIAELGSAFDRVAKTVARHEADLEAAVERQTRLVREVHHRVKNNLQVVASLLNLHSRGAPSEDVSAAYATIQRRVDALAVVHRNHYAELEENRGVALRSLISELGANLRATAPPSAAHMAIRLDIEPYYATQDVAVSVAFLITEIVEFAMLCDGGAVSISLTGGGSGSTARLAIHSASLKKEVPCDEALTERFERIVTGLSRQLRSAIDRDEEQGAYSLDIAVIDKAEA